MRILLLSMPDSSEHTPALAVRMPNGALTSLAGNVDPHHSVTVADLVLVQASVRVTVERLVRECQPDLVGLSVMTFQRRTARRIVSLIRAIRPQVRICVGGYDPSLAPETWTSPELGIDFIVRGEGEATFRTLIRALEHQTPLSDIPGLWYREGGAMRTNAARPVARIEENDLALPARAARVLSGYTMLGRQVDVVETSRGCTYDCSFCSIIEMRGRNFHRFPLARVIADIGDARARGARAIFFVDDNITIDVPRFEALCHAIIDAGYHDVDYLVQGMTAPFAQHGTTLAPLMRRAGFRYVFLGIENVVDEDLVFLNARAKNLERGGQARRANASVAAIEILHRHGLLIVGGLIVGNPGDTAATIETNLAFARRHVDWPYIQHPTPYPGTPMSRTFREGGLITSDRVEEYDGTTAVTRGAQLAPAEIEFMRWRAERWMKVRHVPAVFRHDPLFVVRNVHRMMGHTFRGSSWRSALGLERSHTVFNRYRARRAREREFLDWPDPQAAERTAAIGPVEYPVTLVRQLERATAGERQRAASE
jgi:anaerobic magnesium-protoporphyrin IX monomethyl ester cyclase